MSCDDPQNAMSSFVALTFTDKAAVEMSQRVRKMLQDFATSAQSQTDRRKFLTWLDQLPEARISTIHSFCAAVLRSCAIEAQIDPNFSVCSETLVTDQLLLESAQAAVLGSLEFFTEDAENTKKTSDKFLDQLSELFAACKFDRIVEHTQWLVENRSRIDFASYLDSGATFKRWEKVLATRRAAARDEMPRDASVRDALDFLKQQQCSDEGDKLYSSFARTIELAEKIFETPLEQAGELFDELARLKPGNCGSAKSWGSKENVKLVRGAMKSLRDAFSTYSLSAQPLDSRDERAAAMIATLCQLAINANEHYRQTKLSRGIVDFTDLLVLARDVIKRHPVLRAGFTDGIEQILIDEAQDTDITQLELLMEIIAPDGSLAAMPPGKLFLVGDPKQSIYRFRGAQMEVFENLCAQLGSSQHVDLDMSFRTHAAGVGFVNHLFAELLDARYDPICSHRSDAPDWASVEILIADGTDDAPLKKQADCSSAQAGLTAQRIEEMLTGGERLVWDAAAKQWRTVRPGDIAILFAGMTHALKYERQLQKRNIPYYVVAGSGFFNRQEVYNLLNALRVIDNPSDDIAFFGLLRSEIVGLDDNALMHIAQTVPAPYLANHFTKPFDALKDLLTETQLQQLQFACDLVGRLGASKNSMRIDELLTQLLDETGYEATLLGQFQGKRMLGNVRLLMDKARSVGSQISLSEFITQIGEHVTNESRHEQASVSGEDENVVRLMTIHKAKGLEFPIVFVPELNTARRGVKQQMLNLHDWGLTTKISPQLDDDDDGEDEDKKSYGDKTPAPVSFALAKQQEQRDQQSEMLRKYYVALTRFEDHLVLVGANWRYKDKAAGLRNKGSFLQLLDEQLNLTAAIDAGGAEVSYRDAGKNYALTVRVESPKPPAATKTSPPPGAVLLDSVSAPGEFVDGLQKLTRATSQKTAPPQLLGTLPPLSGSVELPVTALNAFERCEMLYRWGYELRGGRLDAPGASGGQSQTESQRDEPATLDPLELGTFLHRCMELLDFRNPQTSEQLVTQVAAETNLDAAEICWITNQLESMLQIFSQGELVSVLGATDPNDIYRELDFVSDYGGVKLRGQIDLLYRSGGKWCVVDYKSDRVGEGNIAEKAACYELQMLIYAEATSRLVGELPAAATLHFLRTGATHTFEITESAMADARNRITKLTENLIAARRTGNFSPCNSPSCDFCRAIL